LTNLDSFHYLHPLSVLFEIAKTIRNNLIPTVAALLSARSGGWIGYSIGTAILSIGLIVALVRYFTFRYRIEDRSLVIHQGLWGRLNRTVPLDRIQNIDLSQNLFHRLLKVGEVRVETASGTEPEAIMRVLSIAEVEQLRDRVAKQRALDGATNEAANLGTGTGTVVSTGTAVSTDVGSGTGLASEDQVSRTENAQSTHTSVGLLEHETIERRSPTLLLQLPTKLVAIAGLISNRGEVIAGILFGLFWQARFGDQFVPWAGVADRVSGSRSKQAVKEAIQTEGRNFRGLFESITHDFGYAGWIAFVLLCLLGLFATLRIFSSLWYISKFYGYRLELQGDSLHLQCGLFTKISATIPLGRIQVVCIHRTWLMRLLGLAAIRVETAGGSSKSDDAANTIGRRWFVPIIANQEIAKILSAIDSRIEFRDDAFQWQPLAKDASKRMIRPVLLVSLLLSIVLGYFQPYWGWSVGIPIALLGVFWVQKKSRSKRYARTDWGIAFRSGVLLQKCSMTFFEKIQSVQVNQSPFDRRWKMASISVDTLCAGPADHRIDIEMMDSEFANRELERLRLKIR
jgi:putative membrane protein